jgi:site-specific DNA-methyltransferase (adenine-specific)
MIPYYEAHGITIYHGDCRDVLPRLTERAALLWTDSAYEIESGGNTSGQMMGGIFDPSVYNNNGKLFPTVPFAEWVPFAYASMREDADAVLMTNDKNLRDCLNAMDAVGMGLHNVLLWNKQNKTPNRWGMKSVEFLCYGWKGSARVLNDCGMGQVFYDRNPTGDKRHTTEKPASLPYKHIVNMTDPDDLVLDPFGGSMSTMVAAKRAGRRGAAIEIDEAMCEAGALWLDAIVRDGVASQYAMELAS